MSDCTCERDYFMVVGLIVSKNYQQSKYIVEEYGGSIVESSLQNVIIFKNNKYWGTPKSLIKWMEEEYAFSLPTDLKFYLKIVEEEYKQALNKNKLYSDLLPITCENFKCLCTGEKGYFKKIRLSYKGTKLFRLARTGWIQGGELNEFQGETACIYGKRFTDESYFVPKDRRGILCMANRKRNYNASQFAILLNPHEWANYYNVAFGQLVEGAHVLKKLENLDTHYETFIDEVIIENCGVVSTIEPIHKYPVTRAMERIRLSDEMSDETVYKDQGIDFEELVWRAILRRCPEYLYLGKREDGGLLRNIVDPRDVPSTINELSWRLGLYSLPLSTEIDKLFKFVVDNTSLANFFSETSLDKRNFIGGIVNNVHSRMFDILKDRCFMKGLTWLAFERAMFLSLETPEGFCRELMRNIAEMLKLRIESLYETRLAIDEIIARMTNNEQYVSLIVDIFIEDVSRLVIKSCLELVEGEYDEYSEVTRTEIDDQDLMIEKKNQEDINNEVKEISLDEQNVEQNDEQNVENEEDKTEQSEEMKNVEETESDL